MGTHIRLLVQPGSIIGANHQEPRFGST